MDEKFKAKWVRALRSGKFKQTRGKLINIKTGGMCCIGVGAFLKDKKFDLKHNNTFTAAQSFGLSITDQVKLVDLNDDERRNFKTIAAWIEQNL